MEKFLIIGLVSGVLFIVLDMITNVNPFALKLMEDYKPIARKKVNTVLAMSVDIMYGFVLTGIYLLLKNSLPADSFLQNILQYTLLIWFLREFMMSMSSYIIFDISPKLLIYNLASGFIKILAITSFIVVGYWN
jgi:hypothetical protein